MISDQLISAYKKSEYRVKAPELTCTIKIGQKCRELNSFLAQNNSSSWAFITAWNPHSQATAKELNQAQDQKLFNELKSLNLTALKGLGIDPQSDWPGEESWFITGISLSLAKELAKKYQQNAFVFGEKNKLAQLIITA